MTVRQSLDICHGANLDEARRTSRRRALLAIGGGVLLSMVPLAGRAGDEDTAAAIKQLYGDGVLTAGRITLQLPTLAESGNSVPLSLTIDSPMTASDRVLRASVFANRNPRPLIATVQFGPQSGTPTFATNIRLSGTQDVIAVAQMSDHSLWSTQVRVLVTVGACDALQLRY
jgi:sulfur-oxidizing protein SoxY